MTKLKPSKLHSGKAMRTMQKIFKLNHKIKTVELTRSL